MISEKMKELTKNSSAIRAMFEEGMRLSSIYGPENVYDFSLGNPSAPPPDTVKNAIIKLLNDKSPMAVHGYTVNSGDEEVRSFIADSENREFGLNLSAGNIILTCGAAGGLNIVLKCILNPGDEVIAFAPFFGEYRAYAKNYDGAIVSVPVETNTFQPDIEAFRAALSSKTKAVIINTPNNPSGAVYSEETIKAIADALYEKSKELGRPIYLISDEPYRKIVFDGIKIPNVSKYYKNTFVCYSFSKSLSIPGERIGYITVSSGMDGFEEMMNALNVANRVCGFVNAPSLFQMILPLCMNEKVDMSGYTKNRDELYNMLTSLGFKCFKPQGAFYIFPESPIKDDAEFCSAAKEYRILATPGSAFNCPGFFRLAFCVDEEVIYRSRESFAALAKDYLRG